MVASDQPMGELPTPCETWLLAASTVTLGEMGREPWTAEEAIEVFLHNPESASMARSIAESPEHLGDGPLHWEFDPNVPTTPLNPEPRIFATLMTEDHRPIESFILGYSGAPRLEPLGDLRPPAPSETPEADVSIEP